MLTGSIFYSYLYILGKLLIIFEYLCPFLYIFEYIYAIFYAIVANNNQGLKWKYVELKHYIETINARGTAQNH